jgi:hypothetical protein
MIITSTLFAFLAFANPLDDRAACAAGDTDACARIGTLKSLGALKGDLTPDDAKLVSACGAALDAAKEAQAFGSVSRACAPLFDRDVQKTWSALGGATGLPGIDLMLGTGYAEAYCPKLSKPLAGCAGKKAANFSSMKPAQAHEALTALVRHGLTERLGEATATPLVAKFAAAWPRLFPAS